jgi:hypothetical protein
MRVARVTASVRLWAPSLLSRALTWNLTVCSLIPRRAAMVLLGMPSAIKPSNLQLARSNLGLWGALLTNGGHTSRQTGVCHDETPGNGIQCTDEGFGVEITR